MSLRKEVDKHLRSQALESGIIPLSQLAEQSAEQRLARARIGYEDAMEEILHHRLGKKFSVVIFGSARLSEISGEFEFVTKLCKALVKSRDIDIITGGGPGIMTAAHLGALAAIQEANVAGKTLQSRNHGVGIYLPFQGEPNEHVHISTMHREFSTRLQEFSHKAHGAYVAPGGYGTLLELIYLIQLQQVDHLGKDFPIVVHPYWEKVVKAINDTTYFDRFQDGELPLISERDLRLVQFSKDVPKTVGVFARSYDKWREEIRDHVRIIS